eukprot:1332930-Prymnesium_polylepis.1
MTNPPGLGRCCALRPQHQLGGGASSRPSCATRSAARPRDRARAAPRTATLRGRAEGDDDVAHGALDTARRDLLAADRAGGLLVALPAHGAHRHDAVLVGVRRHAVGRGRAGRARAGGRGRAVARVDRVGHHGLAQRGGELHEGAGLAVEVLARAVRVDEHDADERHREALLCPLAHKGTLHVAAQIEYPFRAFHPAPPRTCLSHPTNKPKPKRFCRKLLACTDFILPF